MVPPTVVSLPISANLFKIIHSPGMCLLGDSTAHQVDSSVHAWWKMLWCSKCVLLYHPVILQTQYQLAFQHCCWRGKLAKFCKWLTEHLGTWSVGKGFPVSFGRSIPSDTWKHSDIDDFLSWTPSLFCMQEVWHCPWESELYLCVALPDLIPVDRGGSSHCKEWRVC